MRSRINKRLQTGYLDIKVQILLMKLLNWLLDAKNKKNLINRSCLGNAADIFPEFLIEEILSLRL